MSGDYPQISLQAARVNANFSQKDAAKRLNINVRTLQKYESGEVVPRWDTVKAMEELYGMDADFFFLTKNIANSEQLA